MDSKEPSPTERIEQMTAEAKFSDKVLQNMNGTVLLARFKQFTEQQAEVNVHEVLKESFYFREGIDKIIDLCNSSICKLYDVKKTDSEDILSVRPKKIITSTVLLQSGDLVPSSVLVQSGNFENIKHIPLRFATFFIEINPLEHEASAYKVGLINTTPRRFYYTIDITNSPEACL